MRVFQVMRRKPLGALGGLLILVLVATALLAPALAPHDPIKMKSSERLQAPSWNHPLGTDDFGRDILSRVIYGARISMLLGLGAVAISTLLAAIILGLALSASVMRMTRSMVLEVLREDYVRTAWAKGLPESLVIARHVLKNAMIPVVTVMGLQLSALLGGTVIMESIFVIPGMGKFLLDAITWRDYPVIQGINLFLATGVIVLNLVIDVVYGFLDPRIRFG